MSSHYSSDAAERVPPIKIMASPLFLNHCVVMCFSSSIKPTIATVGVGSTTPVGLSL